MTIGMSLIFDLGIVSVVLVGILYNIRTMRHIARFKAEIHEIKPSIDAYVAAVDRAQASVGDFQSSLDTAEALRAAQLASVEADDPVETARPAPARQRAESVRTDLIRTLRKRTTS